MKLPKFEEFSLENLMEQIKPEEDLMKHFPNEQLEKKRVNKVFVVTVVATLRPGYLEACVMHAMKSRASAEPEEEKSVKINVSHHFQQALCATSFS